ncbi:MAG: DNA repair protein RecO [Flavobacteriaceae bacterium]
MLIATKAIVLSKLKYGDNDLIVKCYTQQKGVLSFMVKRVFKIGKASAKIAYFQPLSQLNLIIDFHEKRTLHTIKDIKTENIYATLHTNVLKSAIVMFLSEVLVGVLNEEEPNEALYTYLETALLWLDAQTEFANFHLLFLLNLTKYLGFYPDTEYIDYPFFNLEEGKFTLKETRKHTLKNEEITLLKTLLGMKFVALSKVKLNAKQRRSFLSIMLVYYELHLGGLKTPKSLQIFNQLFN